MYPSFGSECEMLWCGIIHFPCVKIYFFTYPRRVLPLFMPYCHSQIGYMGQLIHQNGYHWTLLHCLDVRKVGLTVWGCSWENIWSWFGCILTGKEAVSPREITMLPLLLFFDRWKPKARSVPTNLGKILAFTSPHPCQVESITKKRVTSKFTGGASSLLFQMMKLLWPASLL